MLGEALMLVYLLGHQPQVEANSAVVYSPPAIRLASHSFSLEDRYNNPFVNGVFKDNILLTLHYMNGDVANKSDFSWTDINKPFFTAFTLNPGEEFSFHDKTLPDYSKNMVKNTNAHFNYTEGFKYDGDLTGDGVCHLASLLYWTAQDAGLTAYAPTNHNFAVIPEVPKEYGVAIQSPMPTGNLYIKNTLKKPVIFIFNFDGKNLTIEADKFLNLPLQTPA